VRASNERRWPSLRQYLEALRPSDAVTVHADMYADIAWRDAAPLQLNWHSVEQSRDPNMGGLLLPALADLREALAAQGRPGQIDLTGRLRLPAALALGYAFHQATGWRLSIAHDDQTWVAARSDGSLDSLAVSEHPHAPTVRGDLVVVVSIAQDVLSAVRAHRKASGRTARTELRINLASGEGRTMIDAANGNATAAGIARCIRKTRQVSHAGETHIYYAGPWPLAALLGWHLSSSGPVVAWQASSDQTTYERFCRIA
jgi:hypothetical protein